MLHSYLTGVVASEVCTWAQETMKLSCPFTKKQEWPLAKHDAELHWWGCSNITRNPRGTDTNISFNTRTELQKFSPINVMLHKNAMGWIALGWLSEPILATEQMGLTWSVYWAAPLQGGALHYGHCGHCRGHCGNSHRVNTRSLRSSCCSCRACQIHRRTSDRMLLACDSAEMTTSLKCSSAQCL